MNNLFLKLATVGTRSRAGVYALREDDLEELEPALTDEGGSLILISTEFGDADAD